MKRLVGSVLFFLLMVFCAWQVSGAQETTNFKSAMPQTTVLQATAQHGYDSMIPNAQTKLRSQQPKPSANKARSKARSKDGTSCFPKLRAYTIGMQPAPDDAASKGNEDARLGCNPAGALRLQPAPLTGKMLLIGPTVLRAPAMDPAPKP